MPSCIVAPCDRSGHGTSIPTATTPLKDETKKETDEETMEGAMEETMRDIIDETMRDTMEETTKKSRFRHPSVYLGC